MTVSVTISEESARGCGYRKPAKDGVGVYLVGPSDGAPCGRLPFALHACPVCSQGIKAGRGWQWIVPSKLFAVVYRAVEDEGPGKCRLPIADCETCPLGIGVPEGKHGLIWIGEGFYKNASDFTAEAHQMGISRKIKAVPLGFELGKTIVYLAHRHVVDTGEKDDDNKPKLGPGVFTVFKPTGIDLVIHDENQVPDKAEKLAEKYGARIVKVVRKESTQAPANDVPAVDDVSPIEDWT
jgi:hypothetical protein